MGSAGAMESEKGTMDGGDALLAEADENWYGEPDYVCSLIPHSFILFRSVL
jgi:hypothetical protein